MILYNIAQVVFNGWMVYTICIALLYNGHPILGSRELIGPAINSGATRAVYVHYCDKYLEFVDTYFMILRGKMDQVKSIWVIWCLAWYTIFHIYILTCVYMPHTRHIIFARIILNLYIVPYFLQLTHTHTHTRHDTYQFICCHFFLYICIYIYRCHFYIYIITRR